MAFSYTVQVRLKYTHTHAHAHASSHAHSRMCTQRAALSQQPAAAWPEPVEAHLITTLQTPDWRSAWNGEHTIVCTSDRQLRFYSSDLLLKFKISPNSKYSS